MELYRLIYKVCSSRTEANRYLKQVEHKARRPEVVFSPRSGAWVVVLCQLGSREEAEQAFLYFRKNGVIANIQKVNGSGK